LKHNSTQEIEENDVKLAIDLTTRRNVYVLPSVRELEKQLNSRPLPKIPENSTALKFPQPSHLMTRTYTNVPGYDAYPEV
jgi:hypothetical protein